jgi:glycosyltransferase involved in cell wall biosynthesis
MDRKKVNVSVIMAVYNESKEYIQLAIESILTQSLQDFECIIVYDNPENQELWNWLHDYAAKDSRIVLIANEKNS